MNLYLGPAAPPDTPAAPAKLTPFYMWLTGGIFLVAVVCLLLQFLAIGYLFPEPTVAQANFLTAVDYGWKMGFAFAIGLVTGKAVP